MAWISRERWYPFNNFFFRINATPINIMSTIIVFEQGKVCVTFYVEYDWFLFNIFRNFIFILFFVILS